MTELWGDFLTHDGRVAHKWTHYFPIYERHFARYQNRPCVFWEIGVGEGGALQLWKRFLGPYAQVVASILSTRPNARKIRSPCAGAISPT